MHPGDKSGASTALTFLGVRTVASVFVSTPCIGGPRRWRERPPGLATTVVAQRCFASGEPGVGRASGKHFPEGQPRIRVMPLTVHSARGRLSRGICGVRFPWESPTQPSVRRVTSREEAPILCQNGAVGKTTRNNGGAVLA